MAERTIIWTETAIRQRNEIFEYWNLRNKSKQYSQRLNRTIKEYLQVLAQRPTIGLKLHDAETRTFSLGNYNIYYEFDSDHLFVISIWENRQNPEELLNTLSKIE